MSETSIRVDLFNPGQVFACLGFLEAAEVLLGDAEGAFDWSDNAAVCFRLRACGDVPPVVRVLEFLTQSQVFGEAPANSSVHAAWKPAWGELRRTDDEQYPFPSPSTPATVACVLSDGTDRLALEYWGDDVAQTGRDNVKFWAGAGGYPGVALARDALELIRASALAHAADPFALGVPQSSSFRLDWRRDYIPIDAGFSLNAHGGRIRSIGFPLVELLGAVGLTNARPTRPKRDNKLEYIYGVAGRSTESKLWLSPQFLRAALGGNALAMPMRRFRLFMGWPGKEGQARAITTVCEENLT